ncbi:MAG: hypothetical protein ACM3SR_15080 [Ignavibacteriales bacterium]
MGTGFRIVKKGFNIGIHLSFIWLGNKEKSAVQKNGDRINETYMGCLCLEADNGRSYLH